MVNKHQLDNRSVLDGARTDARRSNVIESMRRKEKSMDFMRSERR